MARSLVGQVLNDTYELEEQLAEGGMAAIYLASHRRLPHKRFAVKVLGSLASDQNLVRRFQREAAVIAQLEHPHIVEVVDFNEMPDGRPYLVMQHLAGQSLSARLRDGPPLTTEALLTILAQIASALQAAHEIGVVHRDVKPANIFLLEREEPALFAKVLDFGVSKLLDSEDSLTHGNMLLGTFEFMSPEQAMGGSDEVDATSDIFSLGTLAYYLLTGRLPFPGSNPPRLLAAIRHMEPDLGPLPTAARPVVARALAKEKAPRYQEATTFVRELTAAILADPEGSERLRVVRTQSYDQRSAMSAMGTDQAGLAFSQLEETEVDAPGISDVETSRDQASPDPESESYDDLLPAVEPPQRRDTLPDGMRRSHGYAWVGGESARTPAPEDRSELDIELRHFKRSSLWLIVACLALIALGVAAWALH